MNTLVAWVWLGGVCLGCWGCISQEAGELGSPRPRSGSVDAPALLACCSTPDGHIVLSPSECTNNGGRFDEVEACSVEPDDSNKPNAVCCAGRALAASDGCEARLSISECNPP